MNYMIAGGGTGGHIFPAVAIGEAIREKVDDAQILFVGTNYGMEKELIPKLGYPLLTLPVRGLVGKGLGAKLALLWRLPVSFILCLWLLLRYRPKVVIGVGGYASAPLLVTAALLRVPTMIQEQNAFPGLSNRVGARLARLACCGFAEAAPRLRCPAVVTGNPVRGSFKQRETWSKDRTTLLILGGSQGARALNEKLPGLLKQALDADQGIRVIHQCGRNHQSAVEQAYAQVPFPVRVTPFIEDVGAAMNQALLVICRSGASTIGELKMLGVPAILIPFPAAAHDHQTFNARSLVEQGAGFLLPENELDGALEKLRELLGNRENLAQMAAAYPVPSGNSAATCAEIALALQNKTEVSELVHHYSLVP